jgi:hypothetical protein
MLAVMQTGGHQQSTCYHDPSSAVFLGTAVRRARKPQLMRHICCIAVQGPDFGRLGRQQQQQQQQPSQKQQAPASAVMSGNGVAAQQKGQVKARAKPNKDDGVPLSLYYPFAKLPPDGKTRTDDDENCDPMERSCQTAMYTWETKCKACQGSGNVTRKSRGRSRSAASSYTCVVCHGIGYVRQTSSRLQPPDVNNGTGDMTLGRPVPPPRDETSGRPPGMSKRPYTRR